MTQAIEKRQEAWNAKNKSNLAQVTGFEDRVIELIKATVAPGASPVELATFLYNAKRLGLDPMTRQIYFIKYSNTRPGEIVVGINGYRAQAEASGTYAGSDDAQFEYDQNGAPSKATVTVWKIVGDQRVPFTASVRWGEFYPGDGPQGDQWRKRPHNQLGVRAESHALRKAFPQVMERFDMQLAPAAWQSAAITDQAQKDDPVKIAQLAKRHREIFDAEDDDRDQREEQRQRDDGELI